MVNVYIEVADDDAPVTQITIATNQTLPIQEGSSFTLELSANPTPESYAPIVVELAVEDSIGFFTEFTSTHKVSDNTFRITDRDNPITITAHTENDGIDEDDGDILISIVDKANYIGSEQDIGATFPTNTISVSVKDSNNDVPVVSIAAADNTINSVVEGTSFAFTVTMTPAPPANTLQHIELEVTQEVEANNFFNRLNLNPLYVNDSGMVTAEVMTYDDSDYQLDSDITVTVKGVNRRDGTAIYRVHHTDDSVTFTVNNNDLPVISVSDFNVLEGTEDSEYNLELNLGTASAEDVTIEYVVTDGQGTATIDEDYELVGSEPEKTLSVMIESGEQTAQIPLMIKGDEVDDPVETFVLTLTATNAEFENGTNTINVTGSIVEMPVVSISTTQMTTSDADYIEYTVSASPVTSDLSVLLDVIDAVENIVHENNEEITVSLTAEESSFSDELEFDITTNMAKDSVVAIEIREDSSYIIDENNSKIEVTVVNSEMLPVVSIEGASETIIEGNNAVFNLTVTDQRDINDAVIARTADIKVNVMVIEGSTNFITGTPEMEVTIAPAENSATIVVETTLDDEAEIIDDDTGYIGTIMAVVQAGTNYQSGGSDSGVGEVNILDSAEFPVITFNTENNTTQEGGVIAFPFVVTGAATDDTYEEIEISFEVNTETSTADEGTNADFTIFQSSPTTLAAGDTTGRITIRTNTDAFYEGEDDETFDIVVTATNAVFAESTSSVTLTGTIEDINEDPPEISVSSVSTPEDIGVRTDGDNSDDEVTFAVSLDEPSEVDVTFYVETVDLSATSGVDYTPIPDTCYTGAIEPECFDYSSRPRGSKFKIPAGETTMVVRVADDMIERDEVLGGVDLEGNAIPGLTIPIVNDTRKEANERFLVRFTNARHATFAGGDSITVTGTILDDETRTIRFADVNYEVHEDYDTDDTTAPPIQPDYITDDGSGNYSITLTIESTVPAVEDIDLQYEVGKDGDSAVVLKDPKVDGDDYGVATPADLTILSGTSSATITIPIETNVVDEPDQTFTARITGIDSQSGGQPNAILRRGQPAETTVTIKDTDSSATDLPVLSFDAGLEANVDEMTSGAEYTHTVLVSLDKAAIEEVSFDISTSAGTADAGMDYKTDDPAASTPTSGTIAVGATSVSVPITVVIVDDTDNEGNQTFDVTLSNIRKAVFDGDPPPADLTQTITIVDNEKPTLSLAETAIDVVEDDTDVTITFNMTGTLTQNVDITYNTNVTGVTNPATETADFIPVSTGTATIMAGDRSTSVDIEIEGDALHEGEEYLEVIVTAATQDVVFVGGATTLKSTITILDDESPTLMFADTAQIGEEDGELMITFTLSGRTNTDVVFEYNTVIDSSSTSRADQDDFVGQFSKSVTIDEGDLSESIMIPINQDSNRENDELFEVELSNLVGAVFPNSDTNTATTRDIGVTIQDDEAVPTLTITGVTSNAISIMEDAGPLVLDFVLTDPPSDEDITFAYMTEDGTGQNVTAVAGEDYTGQNEPNGIVMAGESGRIEIPILSDTKFEENEIFTITLSSLQNATFGTGLDGANPGVITVTITNDDDEPTMTIENQATAFSFLEGIGNATFDVVLSNPTYKSVTVNVATGVSGVTDPTEADDFTDPATTLTFAPSASGTPGSTGSTSETISIAINNDSIYEEDEAFVVTVSGVANATFGESSPGTDITELPVTVTILDDEDRSVLTAPATQTVAEGVAGGNLTFDVTLTPATDENTVVDFETITGSAIASDFTGTSSGTVTINATETTAEISIPIIDDVIKEADEEFMIKITLDSTSGNAYINTSPQELFVDVTLTDNDNAATLPVVKLSANATQPTEADDPNNGSNFAVQIEINEETKDTVAVDYVIAGDSATLGADFIANSSGTAYITSGKTVSIPIAIIDDVVYEGAETFDITISNPQNATLGVPADDKTRTFTITENDTEPALSIRDSVTAINAVEGESADIGLVLANPAKLDAEVSYTLANGTASDSDYVGSTTSGSITIPAGTTFKTLSIATMQDTDYEDDETFTLTITNATNVSNTPSGGVLSGTSAIVVTIIDEESVSTLTATISGAVGEADGNATINLALSPDSTTDTVVLYSTVDGTAKAATDYTAPTNGMVTIDAGDATGSFTIAINSDSVDEDNEEFYVDITIQNPSTTRARINGNAIRVPVTITDDDDAPVIALSNSQTDPTEGGNLSATLGLTGHSAKNVSVDYTISGTASVGLDFVGPLSGTAVFDGDPSFITIPIIDDEYDDNDETIIITLDSASNATLGGKKTHTFTITDNDMRPELQSPAITVKENIGTGQYPLILNHPATQSFDVNIAAVTNNPDITVTQQTITFAPGDLAKSFSFTVVDDSIYEPGLSGEFHELTIIEIADVSGTTSKPTFVDTAGGSHQSEAIIRIIDNDAPLPVLSAPKSLSFVEGQASPSVPLELSSDATGNVQVTYSIVTNESPDNTANSGTVANTDVTTATGSTETISTGRTGSIGLTINDDTVFEGNEKFRVKLTGVSGARFAGGVNEIVIPVTIIDDEQKPTLNLDTTSLTISEGGSANIEFSISNATTQNVDVSFRGTGIDGFGTADGLNHANGVSITPGQTTAINPVSIADDDEFEGVEGVSMRITVDNAVIPRSTGSYILPITVNDTDGPVISVVSSSLGVNEPASGTSTENVMVQLNRPAPETITINYYTEIVSGTDTAESGDFTAIASTSKSTATIAQGATSGNIALDINADPTAETNDETFTLHLDVATSTKARFGSANSNTSTSETVTIIDADTTQVKFTNTTVSASEGDAIEFPFTVSPAASSSNTVTLALSFANVGTTVGGDYSDTHSASITLDGTSGEATKISINTVEDSVVELDEEFTITVTATGALLNNGNNSITLTGIITNDDTHPQPTFTIGTITATELSGKATINYTLAGPHKGGTLNYSTGTVSNSATPGSDFIAQTNKSIEVAASDSASVAYSIEIPVFNDDIVEGDESFNIIFSSSDITGVGTHTVTIGDDDDDTNPTLTASTTSLPASITALSVVEGEGKAEVLLTLDKPLEDSLSVSYTLANGASNAATGGGDLSVAGTDYNNSAPEVVFAPGEVSQVLVVPINNDNTYENSGTAETFTITFNSNSALSNTPDAITVSITEDDAIPNITIADSFTFEEKGTNTVVNIPYRLNRATDSAIAVTLTPTYTSGAGKASASDVAITTSQTIAQKGTTGSITLTINQDDLYEGTETLSMGIAVPANEATLTLTDSAQSSQSVTVSITIIDEDSIPVVTVENITHSVGEDADTNIPLKLTGKSERDITVNLTTTPVTAIDSGVGADYVPAVSATIRGGQTGDSAGSIAITIEPDSVSDGGETFIVQISSVIGASVDANGLRPITVTITDPDPELTVATIPALNSGVRAVTEGGEVGFDFSLVRAGTTTAVNTGKPVTITYTVGKASDGAGSDDYEGMATTTYNYTFTSGSSGMIRIPTIDDLINEGTHEDFIITIDSVTGATLANTPIEYTFRITDNDDDPTIRLLANTIIVTETNSGGNVAASVGFELSHKSLTDITLSHPITLGTGMNKAEAEDFANDDVTSNTVIASTITAGMTSGTITFNIKPDTVYEGDETFSTTVDPTGATLTGSGLVNFTIIENDAKPTLTLLPASLTHAVNEGANTAINVKMTGTSEHDISLTYEAIPGTARADDYAAPAAVPITAGTAATDTTATIALMAIQDSIYEGNETFQIRLTSASNANIDVNGLKPVTVTINDATAPDLTIAEPANAVMEGGTATITLTLDQATSVPAVVTFTTTKAGDTAGTADFVDPEIKTVTISSGTTGAINIPIVDDNIDEATTESFTVTVVSVTNVDNATALANTEYTVSITDNDGKPTLTLATTSISVLEGDDTETTNAVIDLTLDRPTDKEVVVDYTVTYGSDGSQAEANDIGTISSPLTIAATDNNLSHSVSIPIVGDGVYEDDEVFTVTFSLASGEQDVTLIWYNYYCNNC